MVVMILVWVFCARHLPHVARGRCGRITAAAAVTYCRYSTLYVVRTVALCRGTYVLIYHTAVYHKRVLSYEYVYTFSACPVLPLAKQPPSPMEAVVGYESSPFFPLALPLDAGVY
jgi:hypothetical protein